MMIMTDACLVDAHGQRRRTVAKEGRALTVDNFSDDFHDVSLLWRHTDNGGLLAGWGRILKKDSHPCGKRERTGAFLPASDYLGRPGGPSSG